MAKHEFAPFEALVERVRDSLVTQWDEIEGEFVRVVETFDAKYAAAPKGDTGWYQSKARYFNDLIVGILGNLSSQQISLRCKRKSQLFNLIDIDICFPNSGVPKIAGEVKALGTPPHPGNKNVARGGASDLHKRTREVAFTSMDLKAAYAPPAPIGSFQQWVDSTAPGYFAFWAVRAKDQLDFEKVRTTLTSLRTYCNGVGAVIYMPRTPASQTEYEVKKVTELSVDRSLREMAQRIA